MSKKRKEVFLFVITILAIAGTGLGCYHIGYKDGYISALRQIFVQPGLVEPVTAPKSNSL